MSTKYISIHDFCNSHHIDETFVMKLYEFELITIKSKAQKSVIHSDELPKLERLLRLNEELGINIEGLEAVHHLLEKMADMQHEVSLLKRKLRRFEDF